MNQEQANRWQDFAVRMANTLYADHKRPSGQWIKDQVEGYFFTRVFHGDDIFEWVEKVIDWDSSERDRGDVWSRPELVTDSVTAYLDDDRPRPQCRSCRESDGRRWDEDCQCEEIEDLAYEQWDEQWGGPVRCCIRAGIDVAVSPSAGVVGFCIGDLRRMFPDGLPDWVSSYVAGGFDPGVIVSDIPDEEPVWL